MSNFGRIKTKFANRTSGLHQQQQQYPSSNNVVTFSPQPYSTTAVANNSTTLQYQVTAFEQLILSSLILFVFIPSRTISSLYFFYLSLSYFFLPSDKHTRKYEKIFRKALRIDFMISIYFRSLEMYNPYTTSNQLQLYTQYKPVYMPQQCKLYNQQQLSLQYKMYSSMVRVYSPSKLELYTLHCKLYNTPITTFLQESNIYIAGDFFLQFFVHSIDKGFV